MNITKLTVGNRVIPTETLANTSQEYVGRIIKHAANVTGEPKITIQPKYIDASKRYLEAIERFAKTFNIPIELTPKTKPVESFITKIIRPEAKIMTISPEQNLREAFESSFNLCLNKLHKTSDLPIKFNN